MSYSRAIRKAWDALYLSHDQPDGKERPLRPFWQVNLLSQEKFLCVVGEVLLLHQIPEGPIPLKFPDEPQRNGLLILLSFPLRLTFLKGSNKLCKSSRSCPHQSLIHPHLSLTKFLGLQQIHVYRVLVVTVEAVGLHTMAGFQILTRI